MTWFPRREDYEQQVMVLPDESYGDKIARLIETIEAAQANIKEVVDKDSVIQSPKAAKHFLYFPFSIYLIFLVTYPLLGPGHLRDDVTKNMRFGGIPW